MAWETLTCVLPLLPLQLYLICMTHQSSVPCAVHRNPQVSYSYSQIALTMIVGEITLSKRAVTKQMNILGNAFHWDKPNTLLTLTYRSSAINKWSHLQSVIIFHVTGIVELTTRRKSAVIKIILQNWYDKLYQYVNKSIVETWKAWKCEVRECLQKYPLML